MISPSLPVSTPAASRPEILGVGHAAERQHDLVDGQRPRRPTDSASSLPSARLSIRSKIVVAKDLDALRLHRLVQALAQIRSKRARISRPR